MPSPTLIIGGGWSGLAAAVTLAQQSCRVHLLESAKQLGGRARDVQWQGRTIDNGQHLMIGAYHHVLNIINVVGLNEHDIFNRIPLNITLHDPHYHPLTLSSNSPLPFSLALAWHLMCSTGLGGVYHVIRLQASIPSLLNQPDISVKTWLHNTKQSTRLITQLWEPLCLASLNTPIDMASAHCMATVLQDSIGKGCTASDLLIPKVPLARLFPDAAAEYIKHHHGEISLQSRVQQLIIEENTIKGVLLKSGTTLLSEKVIITTSPSQAVQLLKKDSPINSPPEYPICTVYLQYPSQIRLRSPMLGMTGTISQWIFDRSDQTPGLMAIVISSHGQHDDMTNDQLIQHVSQEAHQLFPELPPRSNTSLVIREKRATFACTVNSKQTRPTSKTNIKGLWLAGDYITNNYPATLEGAVRNGEYAALLSLS